MAKYRGTDTTWEKATSSAFTTVATIVNMRELTAGLGGRNGQFDQSSYGDTWMDFGAAQKEGNEVTFIMQYDPANVTHQALRTDADAGSTLYIRANHVPADMRYKITLTGLGADIVPARDGSLELHIAGKIVSPGVVEEAIP